MVIADDALQLSWWHQHRVHRSAERFLRRLQEPEKQQKTLMRQYAKFQKDPVYAVEVLDEALVLYKNDPEKYGLSPRAVFHLCNLWKYYDDLVREMRGGVPRPSTTPTRPTYGRKRKAN